MTGRVLHPAADDVRLPGVNALWDVVVSLAQTRFVDGEEPFAEAFKLTGVARAADLVPIGSVCWQVTEADCERILARVPDGTVLVVRWRNGSAEVTVTAADPEALAKAVTDVKARGPVQEPRPEALEVEFCYATTNRVEHVKRRVDAPVWDDISANYPTVVAVSSRRWWEWPRLPRADACCSGTALPGRARRRRSGPCSRRGRGGAAPCSSWTPSASWVTRAT